MKRHGGQCVGKNKCKCLPEWKGRYCTKRKYPPPFFLIKLKIKFFTLPSSVSRRLQERRYVCGSSEMPMCQRILWLNLSDRNHPATRINTSESVQSPVC